MADGRKSNIAAPNGAPAASLTEDHEAHEGHEEKAVMQGVHTHKSLLFFVSFVCFRPKPPH
jgi:hypothetical protein